MAGEKAGQEEAPMIRGIARTAAAVALLAAGAAAQERVTFAEGTPVAMVEGSLAGQAASAFVVTGAAGQSLTVTLESDNPQAYFNILAPATTPGELGPAMFSGAREGRRFEGPLPQAGDYMVQVLLSRAAARKAETASFSLSLSLTGEGAASAGFADGLAGGPDTWQVTGVPDGDEVNVRREPATRAPVVGRFPNGAELRNKGCRMVSGERWCQIESTGQPVVAGWVAGRYLAEAAGEAAPQAAGETAEAAAADANGQLDCAAVPGTRMVPCDFAVTRADAARAEVMVTLPDGAKRVIRFENGRAVGSDATGFAFSATHAGDATLVIVGDQRFDIPDAVAMGE
jgi:Bacterial SH3 domain